MSLRYLGKGMHIVNDNLIVDLDVSSNIPPLWVKVFSESGEFLGILYDIIGPVKDPYGVVRVRKDVTLDQHIDLYYKYKPRKKMRARGR